MALGVPGWLERVWRWLEGLHTLVWLIPAFYMGGVAAIGVWSEIPWFWVLVGTPISAAALMNVIVFIGKNAGTISLREGARIAFEELRENPWGYAAEMTAKALDGRLDFMAMALTNYATIYGKRPPSQILEIIPKEEFRRGPMGGGGLVLMRSYSDQPQYTELAIKRRDLRRAIKRMRTVEPK